MRPETQGRIKAFFWGERGLLLSLALFIFLNWLVLANIENLAHPDYYLYFTASEKLFSGDFKLGFIPPLFPFLLGLLGRLIRPINGSADSFILAGRILSFMAGLGVVYFSHKLLAKFVKGYAFIGTLILVTSPFFLKLLAIPQTDMIYLFFVCAAFYFFLSEDSRLHPLWAIAGGVLTRFEGVLLLGSGFINHVKAKKKGRAYLLISLIPAAALLYLLFLKFAPRLIDKLVYVFSEGHYLYYFKKPGELVHLFYGNFLFFVPSQFPAFLKWLLFFILLVFFFIGLFYLFRTRKRFALSLVFYQLVFIVFKGYAAALDPEVEFRRLLSVIWIFFIAAFIGIYYFFQKIDHRERLSLLCRAGLYCFLVAAALSLPIIKGKGLLLALLLVPGLIYAVGRFKLKRLERTALFLILLTFLGQFYFDAGKRAFRYVKNNTNKAGFVIAAWLNQRSFEDKVLVYSYLPMVHYYLERPVQMMEFRFRDEKIYKNREKLMLALLQRAKKKRIKYIIFDEYLNPEEGYTKVSIQNLLYEEKEKLHRGIIREEESYFQLIRTLLYRGRPVAWVLKPRYDRM